MDRPRRMSVNSLPGNRMSRFLPAVVGAAILLSVAATYAQVSFLGVHFLRVQQEKVHLQMLQGIAGNPWQYRILADVMIEPVIKILKDAGVPQPESLSFIGLRFLQCFLILLAAGIYYRKMGLPEHENLIGLSVLTWSMSYSLYNSDLSFNVFFDVAFYLVAAILILDRHYAWLAVLMIPAAFNRETSALIPLLLFFAVRRSSAVAEDRRRAGIAAVMGLIFFAIIVAGLRFYFGGQPFLSADGYYPGIGLAVLNLRRAATWEQLLITFGIIPLLALIAFRRWPTILRTFFWVVVPAWLIVHFGGALVAETRLLLVPHALIFIPGALFGLGGQRSPVDPIPLSD